jgi:hypothetical protein
LQRHIKINRHEETEAVRSREVKQMVRVEGDVVSAVRGV